MDHEVDMKKLRKQMMKQMMREELQKDQLFGRKIQFISAMMLYNLLQGVDAYKSICLLDVRSPQFNNVTIRTAIQITNEQQLDDGINQNATHFVVFGSSSLDSQSFENAYKNQEIKSSMDFHSILNESQVGIFLSKLSKKTFDENISSSSLPSSSLSSSSSSSMTTTTTMSKSVGTSKSISIYLLKGGFEEFYKVYPFMCVKIEENAAFFSDYYPLDILKNFLFIGDGINAESKEQLEKLDVSFILNMSSVPIVTQDEANELKEKEEKILQDIIMKKKKVSEATKELESIPQVLKPIVYCDDFLKRTMIQYLNLNVKDEEGIILDIEKAVKFIHFAKKQKKKILVMCDTGRSASAAIVCAYLVERTYSSNAPTKMKMYEALAYLKKMDSNIRINKGFWSQLLQFETELVEKYSSGKK